MVAGQQTARQAGAHPRIFAAPDARSLSHLHDSFFAAAAAAKRNVDVTPVDRNSQGRVRPQELQLVFAALDANEIRRGVRELTIALEGEWKAVHGCGRKSRPRMSCTETKRNGVLKDKVVPSRLPATRTPEQAIG